MMWLTVTENNHASAGLAISQKNEKTMKKLLY
jgi:hypothetical protein